MFGFTLNTKVVSIQFSFVLQKEKCIIDEENKYTALEKKAHHCESQLKAYESSSESEVVDRLHYEVADVEQRVKSRNLEIQIFERRVNNSLTCMVLKCDTISGVVSFSS